MQTQWSWAEIHGRAFPRSSDHWKTASISWSAGIRIINCVFYMWLAFPYTRLADELIRLPSGSTAPEPPLYLESDLNSALTRISDPGNVIHRSFIIGGASLYSEVLALSPSSRPKPSALVDRVLLTRIVSPAFDQCDAFMPDFLTDQANDGSKWERALHEDLQTWVEHQVPEGVQEENGIQYEFQMWVRQLWWTWKVEINCGQWWIPKSLYILLSLAWPLESYL